MRIVALVPGGIGDQLLFFPTLDDLKKRYPQSIIDVIAEPRSKDAYRLSQSVNDVIPFNFKAPNSPADWANLLGVIRDRYYDVVISLGKRWTVGFLLWLTGTPVRVGYAGSSSFLLTNPVPLNSDQYAAAMYHDLLKGLGIMDPCPPLSVKLLKPDIEWAEAEQSRLGIAGSGYVMIHGGSSQLAQDKGIDKIYPVENWIPIVQDFRQRQPQMPIVVAKGPEDEAWVAALSKACPDVVVTEPEDLGKLGAMIAAANLMLCTDSAPMHLAVALDVYTLGLFGPTDPEKLLPKSDKFVGLKSPTGKMADLTSDTVLKQVWNG